MFEIEYNGGNALTISTKTTKIVFDPKRSSFGLPDVDTASAVEIGTEPKFLANNKSSKVVIEGPGEYEVGDFLIRGIPAVRHIDSGSSKQNSTVYRLEIQDVSIAVLGNITPDLSESQLEAIGVIDILVIPVGGSGYTLDATSATSIVRRIEPKLVIPVHFADPGLNYEVPQDDVQVFIKEVNTQGESLAKLKIKSASGIPDSLSVTHLAVSK